MYHHIDDSGACGLADKVVALGRVRRLGGPFATQARQFTAHALTGGHS